MFEAATRALSQIFSPPFRRVFWTSIGLTLLMLAALWAVLHAAFVWLVVTPWPGLDLAVSILTGIGLVVGLAFLIAPVTSLFAGLFLDDIAAEVERVHYPADPPGVAPPVIAGIFATMRFAGLVLLVNLIALFLLLVPGLNLIAFLGANAYLLGREYFEQVAVRFMPREAAIAFRRAHQGRVLLAGLVIALFLLIPIVNLTTPLFATAFMVHVFKATARRTALAA